ASNEIISPGRSGGRADRGIVRGRSQSDVLAHGCVVTNRRLEQDRDRAAEVVDRELAKIEVIDGNRTRFRIVETSEQLHQGAFARVVESDKRDQASSVNGE